MGLSKILSIGLTGLVLVLAAPKLSHSVDNVRIAYPSFSSSILYLIIAQKEQYFKEEGLNVELLSIRGEIAARTALAGEIDFFTNAGSAVAAAVRGVPVKILAVIADRPGWDLIAQPNIKSVSQLRGTNIAIMSPEGSLAVVTREILRKNGIDPSKEASLVVMGGDEVRYPALRAKVIQATLLSAAASLRAQKEGFNKVASASDYANLIQSGVVATDGRIKQKPAIIARFLGAALKGIRFVLSRREPAIRRLMEAVRLQDRELAESIYDRESKLMLPNAMPEEKTLQAVIDDMKKTTKIQRDIKVADIFDFSFIKKAGEELNARGWKP